MARRDPGSPGRPVGSQGLAAALIAAALIGAGCGDGGGAEGERSPAVSRALVLASDLTDLHALALAGLERLAAATDETTRADASEALAEVGRDADRLAGEAGAVGGQAGGQLARDSSCLAGALSRFRGAADAELGDQAQAEAEEAGARLRDCLGTLGELLSGLSSESESASQALVARAEALNKDLDAVLPDLVASLAAVEPAVAEASPEQEVPETVPGAGTGVVPGETADLPPCNPADVVLPCVDPATGDVVFGD